MTVGAKTEEDQKRKAMFKKEEVVKEEVVKEEVAQEEDEDAKTENAEAQVNESDEPVHEGFFCNGCQMQPIVGARYKCLECDFSRVIGIFLY